MQENEMTTKAHEAGQELFEKMSAMGIITPQNTSITEVYYPGDTAGSPILTFWLEGQKFCIPIVEGYQ